MKNIIYISFLIFVGWSELIGQNEFEPNNDYLNPALLTCGNVYESYIQELGDKDWFEVFVSEGGVLQVQTITSPNNLDLDLGIYIVENGLLKRIADDDDAFASGGQLVKSEAYLPAGNYLISFQDENDNSSNNTESYSFLVNCLPNQMEPNQQLDLAKLIPQDTCFEADIFGENECYFNSNDGDNDQEWFQVIINESGYLATSVTSVPTNLDLDLSIIKIINGLPVIVADDNDSDASGGQNLSSVAYVDPGTYYIKINDEGNNRTNQETFTFCITFFPNALEVNQTIDLATPIPIDTCFEENIYGENNCYFNSNDGANDQEWYKVIVNESGYLATSVTSVPTNLDLDLSIIKIINGLPVIVADDNDSDASGGQNLSSVAYVDPGTYYIKINDEGNNRTNQETFTFCITFFPNALEVNQTIDLATPIPIDTCFEENIYGENNCYFTTSDGANDQEWYQVMINESGYLKISVTSVPTDIDINLRLFKIINNQPFLIADDNDDSANGGQSMSLSAYLDADTYYIQINDENNNRTNFETFTYCMEFIPDDKEINQTIDLAAPISTDTCFQENICGDNKIYFNSTDGDDDQDWYQFTLNSSCFLTVDITSVPSNLDLNLELYQIVNNQPELITDDGDSDATGGQSLSLSSLLDEGSYYIHIEDESHNAQSNETFTVCIQLGAQVDFDTPIEDVCIDALPIQLIEGTPSGGLFNGSGVSSTGLFDPSLAGVGTHEITYTYTAPNSSCSNSVSDFITVHDLPNSSLILPVSSVLFTDAPFLLSGGMPVGGTYSGTGVANNIFDPSLAILGENIITYTFTDNFGCTNSISAILAVVQMTNTSNVDIKENFTISPNPFQDFLNFSYKGTSIEPIEIRIYDLLGHQIFYKRTTIQDRHSIDTKNFPSGILMIQLQTENGSYTFKSIKMK